MEVTNLKTTLGNQGIGSSFTKASSGTAISYFVSTVLETTKFSPEGRFKTIVKEAGLTKPQLFVIPKAAIDSVEAVLNHIALTRMCISNELGAWREEELGGFRPDTLTEFIDSQMEKPPRGTPLLNQYTHTLLSMAGLNYPPPQSKAGPVALVLFALAVLFVMYLAIRIFG